MGLPPVTLAGVFIVEHEMLPAGVVALFGVADIRALNISLDTVLLSPDFSWEDAVRVSVFTHICRTSGRCFRYFLSPPEIQSPVRIARPAAEPRPLPFPAPHRQPAMP